MSEHNMQEIPEKLSINKKILDVGTVVQVTHAFSKTRDDELDLIPGDLITVLECPEGGWGKGTIGIDTKTPVTGWFPIIVSKIYNKSDQINAGEFLTFSDPQLPIGRKRSRSASIFGKVLNKTKTIKSFESDDKISRTRSTSAPGGTSSQSLVLSNDLQSVTDASFMSINRSNIPNDILSLRIPDSDKKDDSTRSSAQPKPLISLKGSFTTSPTKEYMALKELADTEWHYLQDLYLIRHCRKVLSKLLALSDKALKTLFGNLDQLINVHEILNDDLEVLMVQGTQSATQLSNIFAARMEDFLVYIEYGNNYQAGQDKLKKLAKKVNARDVFKRIRTQPRSRNLGIESFLIAPIQRICKYPLLLKQIIKDFESDARDTTSLKETLGNMEKNMTLINDAMKQSSTPKKTAKSFKKSYEKPGCTMLKEEKVFLNLGKKTKKKGYAYLFNDSVVIAQRAWGGKWTTILDVSLADPSFILSQGDKPTDCLISVKRSSLIITFKSTAVQQSFKKTFTNLLESCKSSKHAVLFDAVVALDGVGDASDGDSDFSDDAGSSTSTHSIESPTPVTQGSIAEFSRNIPSPEPSPETEGLESELKNFSRKLEIIHKENQDILAKNESLKETVINLEDQRDDLIDQINILQDKNENLKNNLTDVEQQFKNLKNDTAKVLSDTEECNLALQEELVFYKDLQLRLNIATEKADELAEKNESLSSEKLLLQLEVETLKSDLDKNQEFINDGIKQITKLTSEVEDSKLSRDESSRILENIKIENQSLISSYSSLIKNIGEILSIEPDQRPDIPFLAIHSEKDRKEMLELVLEKLKKSIDELQSENKNLKNSFDTYQNKEKKVEETQNKIDSLSGFVESIAEILLVDRNTSAITNKVGKLISLENQYTQFIPKYEEAISSLKKLEEDLIFNQNELQSKAAAQDEIMRINQILTFEKDVLYKENTDLIKQSRCMNSQLQPSKASAEERISGLVSEKNSLNETICKLQDEIKRLEEMSQSDKILQKVLQDMCDQQKLSITTISAENDNLKLHYKCLMSNYTSHIEKLCDLLLLKKEADDTQMSELIEKELKRLLQLESDSAILVHEKAGLLSENDNLQKKLIDTELLLESESLKLSNLEGKVTGLLSEKSINDASYQKEINDLNLIIERERMKYETLAKIADTDKNHLDASSLEHWQQQTTSQTSIIDRILSHLSLKNASDHNESLRLIEEESKRLINLESEFKTVKSLYQKVNQEKEQLLIEIKASSETHDDQNMSVKKEYESLQERYTLLLNDLHNNQARLYKTEKELESKNGHLNDLEIKFKAAVKETHEMKNYVKELSEKSPLNDQKKILEAEESENGHETENPAPKSPEIYYAMISKLEKEMMENKHQLIESKEALKEELKTSQAQNDKRGNCLRKLYGQLQEALKEKERLYLSHNSSQQEILNLRIDKSKLIVERESYKKQIDVLQSHLTSLNEKSVFAQNSRCRKEERSEYESRSLSTYSSDKEVKVWKTIFFEIEVILGLSEKKKKNLPTLDQEVRVANTLSKIRSIEKEIKEARKQSAESQDIISNMGKSLRDYDVRMNELLSSITTMAQEIKTRTLEFENEIYEKNIMIDDLVKKNASANGLKVVKQERQNYELRLRDSNELIRQLSAELSVLNNELEKSEKTVSEQEVMISDFCIKTQRLQAQIARLQERLDEAQNLEADHIFELDKLERRLNKEIEKKSEQTLNLNSAETLASGHSINYENHVASTTLAE